MANRNLYFVPMGRMNDHPHPHPDRTAYQTGRTLFDDYRFRVWSSRGAMLQACKMSEDAYGSFRWKPLTKEAVTA